ncbi:YciI family protein [Chryseolinea sp. T2]|uniref:YciI family protein n=1 Tax=Chryseolinea sp. T2 TaxID=3129255 RepID=UPI0030781BAB
MEEYIILMRLDLITRDAQPSPEQLQVYMQQYHSWIDGIVAAGKFVGGKGLSTEGKVIRFGKVITDGPFAEVKESIAGFISIRATDFDDAARIAADCPILNGKGNSVEVRRIVDREQRS